MAIFKSSSSNPALNSSTLKNIDANYTGAVMTINGTITKTIISVLLVVLGGAITFMIAQPSVYINEYGEESLSATGVYGLMLAGGIGGFILALITIFKQNLAPYTAPLYSILEGLFLGGASIVIPMAFNAPFAIVGQAIAGTVATFFVMLILYRTGIIKVNQTFKTIVIAATFGLATAYLVFFIMSFFSSAPNFLMGSSVASIGITAFACVIAALNLALDFDLIDELNKAQAPKYYEWYGAFSITVTLVWLYLELLRLLAKLSNRN